jgi:hypothetical protein
MDWSVSRRMFLAGLPAIGALASSPARAVAQSQAVLSEPSTRLAGEVFPSTDPGLVARFVGAAHANLEEVRRLVERQPSLARASWDWGFGDWESGLGAASHMGRRDIAEVLLAHGARPSIFSAAMLGQLDVVTAFVAAGPGIQGTLGPHGITLMAHARAGGAAAQPVVAFLERVGGADNAPVSRPLEVAERDALAGRYVYGEGPRDLFEVDVRNNQLGVQRPGATRRLLIHLGGGVFFPSGVPSVKVTFVKNSARATQLTIADPDVTVTARRA